MCASTHDGYSALFGWRRIGPIRAMAAVAVSLAIVASGSRALASNGTWTNATSGGVWSNTGNWSSGTVADGTDSIADFSTLDITADNTVHLDSARTIGGLIFGDTTPSNNWILDNNGNAANILTLAVSSGAPTITVNNQTTATINAVLAGTQGLNVNGGGTPIPGFGTLILGGANTYSGGTVVNTGTLLVTQVAALPDFDTNGNVSVVSGATLAIQAGGSGEWDAVSLASLLATNAFANNSNIGISVIGTNSFTYGGDLGATQAAKGLTKLGSGTLTLTGSNTYASDTIVNGGTLNITSGGSVSSRQGLIGFDAGSTATVNVSGSTSQWANNTFGLTVGLKGNGTLNVNSGASVAGPYGEIGAVFGSTGLVTISGSGSQWNDSGNLYVGFGGTGTLNVNSGGLVSSATGYIGQFAGSTATVSGSGSQWNNSGSLYVGGSSTSDGGTGALSVNGGAVTVGGTLKLWDQGTLTINGGTVTTNSFDRTLGTLNFNDGTLTINGGTYSQATGTLVIDGNSPTALPMFRLSNGATTSGITDLYVGNVNQGSATVSGASSKLNVANYLYVGVGPHGTLIIQNGGAVSDYYGRVGYISGSTGTATIDGPGSNWTNGSEFVIGFLGQGSVTVKNGGTLTSVAGSAVGGTLNIQSGATATMDSLNIFNNFSAIGSVNVTDHGSTLSVNDHMFVGGNGAGALTIQNGGQVTNSGGGDVFVGENGASGVLTVSGTDPVNGAPSTLSVAHALNIGTYGSGILTVQGGAMVGSNSAQIGANAGSTGSVTVTGAGSTWNDYTNLEVGSSGTGALTIQHGGHVNVNFPVSTPFYIGVYAGSHGTVLVSDPSSALNVISNITVGNSGGQGTLTIQNGATVNDANGSVGSFNGSTGTITIDGIGSSWLNSVDVLMGAAGPGSSVTVQNSGVLSVTDDMAFDGAIIVQSGATASSRTLVIGTYSASAVSSATVTGQGSAWSYSQNMEIAGTGNGTLNIQNGGKVTDTGAGTVYVGENTGANGTLNINSGGSLSSATGYVGYHTGSTGAVTVSGIGSQWTNSATMYVGYSGTGTLAISSGGSVSSPGGSVGYNANSAGTVNISGTGSQWTSISSLYVGVAGNGTINVNSGGLMSSIYGDIGEVAGGTGLVTVSGSGSQWMNASNLYVGVAGNATLNVNSGGAVSNASGLSLIGFSAGSAGAVTVTGGGSQWTNSSDLYIGYHGSGTLNLNSGGLVSNATGYVGYDTTAAGVVTVSGSGSKWTNSVDLRVGTYGNGTLNVQNGGTISNSNGYVAYIPGSVGNVTVTGSGSQWNNSGSLYVGESGNGTLNVNSGGVVVSSADSIVGHNAGSVGTVIVSGSGSQWSMIQNLYLGYNGYGTVSVSSGGSVSSGAGLLVGGSTSSAGGTGALSVSNGGTVTVGSTLKLWNNDTLTIDGGTVTTRSLDVTLGNLHFNDGTLTVNGGAYSEISAGNTTTIDGNTASAMPTFQLTNGATTIGILNLTVGNVHKGNLSINGGATVSSNSAQIGANAGSTGSVTVSGSGSQWTNTNDLVIGVVGIGTLNITSGGSVSSYYGYIGSYANSTGTVTISGSGSQWTTGLTLYVGHDGNGTLNVSSGGSMASLVANIGEVAGSNGLVTVSGAGSQWMNAGELDVGVNGGSSGALNVNSGGSVTSGSAVLAIYAGSAGTVTVGGSGSQWNNTGSLYVGNGGTGALNINSGGLVSSASSQIGNLAGSIGTANINGSGSTWTTAGTLNMGATGSLNINGGLVQAGGFNTSSAAAATINLNGGTLRTSGWTTASTGSATALNFNGGTLQATAASNNFLGASPAIQVVLYPGGATIDTNGNSIAIAQNLTSAVNSGVSAVTILNFDTSTVFNSPPALSFSGGGATGYATLDANGFIAGVVVTNPGSFTTAPSASIVGSTTALLAVSTAANSGGGLTKIGAGTLTLSGNNTFTGGMTINAGTLQVGSAGALNLTAPNAVAFGPSSTGILSLAGNNVTVSGLTTNAVVGSPVVTNADGVAVANATLTVDLPKPGSTNTFAGALQNGSGGGTLGLNKTGAATSTLILTGASSYTGATSVNGGTLVLGPTAALGATPIAVAANAAFAPRPGSGSISAGGSLTLNPGASFDMTDGAIGAFNLTTSGAALVIGGGSGAAPTLTFEIGNAAAGTDKIAATGNVSVLATGGSINIGATAATIITPGDYNLITSTGGFSGAGGNNFALAAGSLTLASGTTYNLSLVHSTATNEILTVALSAAAPAIAYWNGAAGSTWNTVNSGNVTNWRTDATQNIDSQQPPGANTNVFFTVNSGATNLTNTLGADFTINSLTFSGAGTSAAGPVTIGGTNTLTIGAGGLTVQAGSGTQVINSKVSLGSSQTWTNNSANPLTVNGVVGGGGAIGLSIGGSGTVVLSGNNIFTGGLTINAGQLQLGGPGALNSSTPNTVAFGANSTGALSLAGNSVTIGGLSTNATVGTPIVQNANPTAATLTVNNAANNTFAGVLQNGAGGGALSVVKMGGGTLVLGGNNTFTGPLTVNEGTLDQSGPLAADVHDQAAFVYDSGSFGGRLFVAPAATAAFNANFNAANGMENRANLSIPSGRTVALAGAGLDNEAPLTIGGTLNLNAASNANNSIINLNGAINVAQAFANSGVIQLTTLASSLSGGAVTNTGTLQGIGSIGSTGSTLINAAGGTIEPIGGTLFLAGALQNQAGATLAASSGNKLLATAGLATNPGVISLTGGTFSNNGHPLNNTGTISGYGTFSTGGLDNNGNVAFTGGTTTVNGPVTNEFGRTIELDQTTIFNGLLINNGGTLNTVSTTGTFAGGFTNVASSSFKKTGNGLLEIKTAPTLNNNSSLIVSDGTLRFNVSASGGLTDGSARPFAALPTIGTGVTATISGSATLELAGSISDLSSLDSHTVSISSSSSGTTVHISGNPQIVGNIDTKGMVQVDAGAGGTANHINASGLIIGGTSGDYGLVTVDASDAAGNPLDSARGGPLAGGSDSSGFILAGSLVPASSFLPSSAAMSLDGSPSGSSIDGGGSLAVGAASAGSVSVGGATAVPEPSSLLLAALAVGGVAVGAARRAKRLPPSVLCIFSIW